uniref:(northern house mosquito) hypothetical protein n=1 Tax=Culex pipiens TaxID=7175 RepID=A0A8D8EAV7_CULPI
MLVDLDRRERTVQHRPQVDETSRVVVDLRRATFRFHPNVVDSASRAGQLERAVVQRVVGSENFRFVEDDRPTNFPYPGGPAGWRDHDGKWVRFRKMYHISHSNLARHH